MNWFDILKNIQISGQKTTSRDIASPDNEDEDCFKYFYDLVKLMHPDFELKRNIYGDIQSEDYWCRVKNTPWVTSSIADDVEFSQIGEGVIDTGWSEIQIFYSMDVLNDVNRPYKKINLSIPETPDDETFQSFEIYETDALGEFSDYRKVDNIEEIWEKMKRHMEAK